MDSTMSVMLVFTLTRVKSATDAKMASMEIRQYLEENVYPVNAPQMLSFIQVILTPSGG